MTEGTTSGTTGEAESELPAIYLGSKLHPASENESENESGGVEHEVEELLESPEIETAENIRIFLIRHGQSAANTESHLVGGRSHKTPLTEKGIGQSQELGRSLREQDIYPDRVYVSPANRTVQTAGFCLHEMGLNTRPIIEEAIQELGQGIMEGMPRELAYTKEVKQEMERLDKHFKFEEGESMYEVGRRMHGWLVETFGKPEDTKKPLNVFVFTHGIAIKSLLGDEEMKDLRRQDIFNIDIDNTSVTILSHGNGDSWEIDGINIPGSEVGKIINIDNNQSA